MFSFQGKKSAYSQIIFVTNTYNIHNNTYTYNIYKCIHVNYFLLKVKPARHGGVHLQSQHSGAQEAATGGSQVLGQLGLQ
jgi:hypothetical protein